MFYVEVQKYVHQGEERYHCTRAARPSVLDMNSVYVSSIPSMEVDL
jgi:hypothetical protein